MTSPVADRVGAGSSDAEIEVLAAYAEPGSVRESAGAFGSPWVDLRRGVVVASLGGIGFSFDRDCAFRGGGRGRDRVGAPAGCGPDADRRTGHGYFQHTAPGGRGILGELSADVETRRRCEPRRVTAGVARNRPLHNRYRNSDGKPRRNRASF